MDPKSQVSRPTRLVLVCALVSLGTLSISPPVQATSSLLRLWRSAYPNSTSDDDLADPCALYHSDKYSQLNAHGSAYQNKGLDFSAIESLNSDGDPNGTSNLDEINANTQPVWTEGAHNVLNTTGGAAVSNTALPVEVVAGTYDPAAPSPTKGCSGVRRPTSRCRPCRRRWSLPSSIASSSRRRSEISHSTTIPKVYTARQ